MKTINVTFEDPEMEKLERMKGDKSWRKFIMDMFEELDNLGGSNE